MKRATTTLLAVLALAGCRGGKEEPEAKPLVTVTIAKAEMADVQASVRAPAVVHPRQQAGVASRITAPILELFAGKGDAVAAGARLARLESRDLTAQREDALAAVRQAEVLADRRAHLFQEGAIPERDLLASRTELAQLKARLELIETQLTYAELRSPFAGRITEQFLYPGDMAQPSTPVFTVADIEVVVARAQVPQDDAGPFRIGLGCAFLPGNNETAPFAGRLSVLNRAVDAARQTVEAWCEIPNAQGRLLPGTFGELRVKTGAARRSLVVPTGAVQLAEGTRAGSVFVVDKDGVAHRKDVEAGDTFDGRMQILKGLDEGETVVVEGAYSLPDGASVRVKDAAAAPEKAEAPDKDEK
jgi:RND family efflux transporter MFP subunit